MNNANYKLSIENRLTQLEVKLDDIINNHISHIQERLDRIQWLLIVTLIGVVVDFGSRLIK